MLQNATIWLATNVWKLGLCCTCAGNLGAIFGTKYRAWNTWAGRRGAGVLNATYVTGLKIIISLGLLCDCAFIIFDVKRAYEILIKAKF